MIRIKRLYVNKCTAKVVAKAVAFSAGIRMTEVTGMTSLPPSPPLLPIITDIFVRVESFGNIHSSVYA